MSGPLRHRYLFPWLLAATALACSQPPPPGELRQVKTSTDAARASQGQGGPGGGVTEDGVAAGVTVDRGTMEGKSWVQDGYGAADGGSGPQKTHKGSLWDNLNGTNQDRGSDDDPLKIYTQAPAVKDPTIKLNRRPGDVYRYNWCDDDDEHLSAGEKTTVAALKRAIGGSIPSEDCVLQVAKALKGVKKLNLTGQSLSDLSPLFAFSGLTHLNLSRNQLREDPYALVGAAKTLIYLDLSYNRLTSANAIGRLTQLQQLNLSHNKLTDVNSLRALKKVTDLDISYNNVRSILALLRLKARLNYEGNPDVITEVGEKMDFSSMPECQPDGVLDMHSCLTGDDLNRAIGGTASSIGF